MEEVPEQSNAGAPDWAHNPVTGEYSHVLVRPEDVDGRRGEFELFLQPGAAVAAAHTHDSIIERFEVLEGEVGFLIGDVERPMRPGDGVGEVLAGTVHDWWNAGDGIARVRVEVEVAPGASGDPTGRFVEVIETLWSLAVLGKVNDEGLPDPLWLAAIAHEYRDVIRFVKPPAAVQAVVFPPLAAVARRIGPRPARSFSSRPRGTALDRRPRRRPSGAPRTGGRGSGRPRARGLTGRARSIGAAAAPAA